MEAGGGSEATGLCEGWAVDSDWCLGSEMMGNGWRLNGAFRCDVWYEIWGYGYGRLYEEGWAGRGDLVFGLDG